MAALALATETPTKQLLQRPPYGRNSRLITLRMWRFILGHAAYQLCVLFIILYSGRNWSFLDVTSDSVHNTIIFNTFVLCQVWNELNARRLENELNVLSNITTNYIFLGVILLTLIVQAAIVQFGGIATQTSALTLKQWGFCVAVGMGELIYGLLLKFLPVPAEKTIVELQEDLMSNETTSLVYTNESNEVESSEDEASMAASKSKGNSKRDPLLDWERATKILSEIRIVDALRRTKSKRHSWPLFN